MASTYPSCRPDRSWAVYSLPCWLAAGLVLCPLRPLAAAEQEIRLPVVRDTWFSAVGDEGDCNTGGSSRLKVKSIQEMSLVDIDPGPLRGHVVRGAVLHLRLAGSEILRRITVSTFSSEWVEGTAERYQPQAGSSTFNHQKHPDVPWAQPGSNLTAVILGQGGSLWHSADATPPDPQGWQQVEIDPRVVAARVAGVSYGFFVFDDTGSEWTRNGEQFTLRLFPNRFLHSRQSRPDSAPYLTVTLGPADHDPPKAPEGLAGDAELLPAGEADVSWRTPGDRGPAGTIGFLVDVSGKPAPRYLIPPAGRPGERASMRLRDLGLAPGAQVDVAVRAVDAAGNVGPAAKETIRVSARPAMRLPGETPDWNRSAGPLPVLGNARVAILDALDKIHPITRELIPKRTAQYLAANPLWNAGEKRIRLFAARNEFVEFQVALAGELRGVRPSLTFQGSDSAIAATWGRYRCVPSKLGPLPDPIVPLAGPFDVPDPQEKTAGQRLASLHCEVYVPHEAKAGDHRGTLSLRAGGEKLELDVVLHVWDFTLPDSLSFLPEMNCYGLPSDEREYYRLAHLHRTVLNRVPYHQNGEVAEGCAPRWDGRKLDFAAWDRRFGPYLDGSAFADLPRRGVPIECFYLPLHENWPTPMEKAYNGNYWADAAFPPEYRHALVEVARRMAEHFAENGWRETLFHGFLNNKIDFKRRGWSRGSSPWLLDEPANFQDYWALRWFGDAFHEGWADTRKAQDRAPKLCFRCDVSRPEWQRDTLDPVLDYNVVGSGALRRHRRLVIDRKERFGQIVVDYGSTNALEESNVQPVGWCLDSWCLGSNGVVPWQTVGNDGSWKQADPLALFYPGRPAGYDGPIPSIRLKAYRRGQQDVEYLTLLTQLLGDPAWAVGEAVRQELGLEAQRRGTGYRDGEDAGIVEYARLLPEGVWAVRIRVGQAISDRHPTPRRKVTDLRTPIRPRTGSGP